MNIGQKIIDAIEMRRDKQRKAQANSVGKFWRDGGNELLYDLPVSTGDLVIDAGGYKGDWTSGMITRYGCKSHIYEPIPAFVDHCQSLFKQNELVQIHPYALGGVDRKTKFSMHENGTSEFLRKNESQQIDVEVVDIVRVFNELNSPQVACLKLNIEGGEYEVLEKMLDTNNLIHCKSLLIQFHKQPQDYELRYKKIVDGMRQTHIQVWEYEMVWEKWVLKKTFK